VIKQEQTLLVCAGAFWLLFIVRTLFWVDGHLYATLFDDAMISMRYARNFAEGHGLVWNPGAAPVQGYTNPLWTFVMAAVHAAGVPPRLAADDGDLGDGARRGEPVGARSGARSDRA